MSSFLVLSANEAVSLVSYKFIDVSCVYPITPSSEMSEKIYKMSYDGVENLFGQKVIVQEMQSEAGCAGVLHGALTSGALCSTFTCSNTLKVNKNYVTVLKLFIRIITITDSRN